MSEIENWMTCAEAAAATGYNAEHVRRLAREGKIKARRAGNAYLVYLPSLRAYVAADPDRRGPQR